MNSYLKGANLPIEEEDGGCRMASCKMVVVVGCGLWVVSCEENVCTFVVEGSPKV